MFGSPQSYIGRIIDNYRLIRILGTGGASVVYLGQHTQDEADEVAVKILMPHTLVASEIDEFRVRFLREAQTLQKRLRHPHILPVLHSGQEEDLMYMLLPYMSGGTLAERLTEGPLSLEEVESYVTPIANALDFAHRKKIVHRDIKPSNVLLDQQGNVYLADFGIAKLFDTAMTTITDMGRTLGTPEYMSPEQAKGEEVSAATDIYGLGVLTYHIMTGKLPFPPTTLGNMLVQIITKDPISPDKFRKDIPAPAQAVILRALAKDPSKRFATAGAFAEALKLGLAGEWSEETALKSTQSFTTPPTINLNLSAKKQPSPSSSQNTIRAVATPPTFVIAAQERYKKVSKQAQTLYKQIAAQSEQTYPKLVTTLQRGKQRGKQLVQKAAALPRPLLFSAIAGVLILSCILSTMITQGKGRPPIALDTPTATFQPASTSASSESTFVVPTNASVATMNTSIPPTPASVSIVPKVTITWPTSTANVYWNDSNDTQLAMTAIDQNSGNPLKATSVTWFDNSATISSNGTMVNYAIPTVGSHTFQVHWTGENGLQGQDSVTVNVHYNNATTPAYVSMSSPAPNANFYCQKQGNPLICASYAHALFIIPIVAKGSHGMVMHIKGGDGTDFGNITDSQQSSLNVYGQCPPAGSQTNFITYTLTLRGVDDDQRSAEQSVMVTLNCRTSNG